MNATVVQATRWAVAAAALGGAALVLLLGATLLTNLAFTVLLIALPTLSLLWAFAGDLLLARTRVLLLAWLAALVGVAVVAIALAPGGPVLVAWLFWLLAIAQLADVARVPAARERARVLARQLAQAPWRLPLLLWVVFMIPAPLIPEQFPLLAYLSTSMLTLGVLLHALRQWGARAWLLFVAAFAFGVVIEYVGYQTGVPFGSYAYIAPGPSILGVPLLVPLGWFAFGMVALAVAPQRQQVLWGALALVAWDVGLDPLMVREGFWVFARQDYFGVPWTNFAGWFAAGMLLLLLLRAIEPRLAAAPTDQDLRWVFLTQAFLIAVGLAFFGMPVAGVLAAVVMLGVFALARRVSA